MKKILAVVLAALLVMSLTACGQDNDIRGDVTGASKAQDTSSAAPSEPEESFDIGKSEGGVYENKFLGLGIKLDGWTFATDAEMAEMNNTVAGMLGDEYAKAIENNQVIYDMSAKSADQFYSVNVNFENLVVAGALLMSEDSYIENTIKNTDLKSMFAEMGYENITVEKATVSIAGKEHPGMTLHATVQGYDFYERVACIKKGKYMANITVSALGTDKTQELLDSFYTL